MTRPTATSTSSPTARRLDAALDAAGAVPELPAAPVQVAVPVPAASSPVPLPAVTAPAGAAPVPVPAEPLADPDTAVLGRKLSSAPVAEVLPVERVSRASAIGRYALPIGIAVALVFAVGGAGAAARVRERWRER